ncbi:MAG: PQQ-like beta-propeller repeat protein [Fibrobacteres bacterium]|nr:PQQ-like beta-propeller repeat protein [Fibrobacterota bacterium]
MMHKLILILVLAASPMLAENFELFGLNKQRTNYSPETGFNPAKFKLKWRVYIQETNREQLIVADGKVFLRTLENHVYAFDTSDGSLVWKHRMEVRSQGTFEYNHSLFYYNGLLGFKSYYRKDPELTIVRAATGEVKWKKGDAYSSSAQSLKTSCVGHMGYILASGRSTTLDTACWYGIDSATGSNVLFRVKIHMGAGYQRNFVGAIVVDPDNDSLIYAGYGNFEHVAGNKWGAFCYNIFSKNFVWHYNESSGAGELANSGSLALYNDTLLIVGYNKIYLVNRNNGAIFKTFPNMGDGEGGNYWVVTPQYYVMGDYGGNDVHVFSHDGTLIRSSKRSTVEMSQGSGCCHPFVVGEYAFRVCGNLGMNDLRGARMGIFKLQAIVEDNPSDMVAFAWQGRQHLCSGHAFANGKYFVCGSDGYLYCFGE